MLKPGKFKGLVLFIAAFVLLSAGVFISRLMTPAKPLKSSQFLMGTIFDITAVSDDERAFAVAAEKAFSEIRRIEAMMSRYMDGSDVSAVNRNSGIAPVKVSPELIQVLKDSVRVSEISEGAFDATIGPLAGLWGFDEEKKRVPSREEIESARRLVNFRRMKIDEASSTVFLEDRGMMVDVGGIAKGYALGRAMKIFEEAGIGNVIINAGGNLNLRGNKHGKLWRIGIQDPRDEGRLLGAIDITDTSISTSGDYQRYFIHEEARFHHILDPKTGYPAKGIASVTVTGRDETFTDAYSTAVFVMGPEKGLEFMKKSGIEGVIVAEDGGIIVTKGLESRVSLRK